MGGKVVVVGSFNTDLVTYMPRLPQAGETVAGHEFVTGPGGKGSNQAVAAARLGGDVHFIGRVGRDSFADIGWRLWGKHGIQTEFVYTDEATATGIASIFVQENGENMIALATGANGRLSPADIDRAEAAIRAADVLLVQLEVPIATVQQALRVARKHGLTTILNPAPAQPLSAELLALADYITPNEGELRRLTGVGGEIATAARALCHVGQTVIVTLGEQGAFWMRDGAHGEVAAFRVAAVDTVGAGDAFNGALAVALAEKRPLEAAIQFANAAAALAVTKQGAAASMPSREAVMALLQSRGD